MNEYRVIGLMSGTSLDGLDIAFCYFNENRGKWSFRIECAETIEYPIQWQAFLSKAHLADKKKLDKYHIDLGKLYGEYVDHFIRKHSLKADFISSHGHTIFHQPEKGITLQIGDGETLAISTGITVVNDFRTQDVTLGGQGAPLVPIGDSLLFSDYTYCLNLGGFANISFDMNDQRVAFDICPVNTALNYLAQQKGLLYDDQGLLASEGQLIPELYDKLNKISFYQKKGPKTLGKEWLIREFIPLIEAESYSIKDKLATVCLHIAEQIKRSTEKDKDKKILISGGGVYNKHLYNKIKEKVSHRLIIPDDDIVRYKEAMVFAFLGVLRARNEINCLRSVTGAKKDHCSGMVFTV